MYRWQLQLKYLKSTMTIVLSIIVCTYNRESLLPLCLQSLTDQAIDKRLYEVIVVNNNSTDGTQEVAESFAEMSKNLRVVLERRQGLSHARNRGWMEAQGKFVAYIDDDAIAWPDWIYSILDFIKRHPDSGIFGGPYDPFYLVPPPNWFPPEYGRLNLGVEERSITLGSEWINGSNMVIRKELFYLYGGFDERLGMIGCKSAYGEEINYFILMHGRGYPIFYVPTIKVKHLVAEYKMNLNWLFLSGYSVGRQYELTFNIKRSLLSHLTTLMIAFCRGACGFLLPAKIPFKRRWFLLMYPLYYHLGAVVEHVFSYHYRQKP